MVVWGGEDSFNTPLNTGGRYNPGTDIWAATSTTNAPTARQQHTAVWTGSEMIVWGGAALNTGGRYCAQGALTQVQFSSATYSVNENAGRVTLAVTRTGDASGTSSVDFKTGNDDYAPCSQMAIDHLARQNCKFIRTEGTLNFNPGDTSKTFSVLIIDEGYVEGNTTFPVTLTNLAGGALGIPSTETVTIIEDDTPTSISPAPFRFEGAMTHAQERAANARLTQPYPNEAGKRDLEIQFRQDAERAGMRRGTDGADEESDPDIPRRIAGKFRQSLRAASIVPRMPPRTPAQ